MPRVRFPTDASCPGCEDDDQLADICIDCSRRGAASLTSIEPPAARDDDGEWDCIERRFAGHVATVEHQASDSHP